MDNDPLQGHWGPMVALLIFTLVSLGLGVVANRITTVKAGFLKKYFLGNRSMGAVAVALTAAVMSGGTFLGVPSTIYRYGWPAGLWIASYMVASLPILGILGKRIGQISRRTGAITLPDLFRERYGSPALGVLSSILIMFFLMAFLVAQFKAGALIMQIVLPRGFVSAVVPSGRLIASDQAAYVVGLIVFAVTVVAYTAYGGFLAAIWTDVFQSVIMAFGVLILLPLALAHSGGLERATQDGMQQAGPLFAFGPGPGPVGGFLPVGLAFSFFVMWPICGMGQPSTLVRLMAFRDSKTLRYSIIYQTLYNAIVYIPIILIFIMARSILPGMSDPDQVMPLLVVKLANPYLAGLILAAPYGAVMSTVSGFLLIVASGFVRDIYQRFLRPNASEREISRASYGATVAVGIAAAVLALDPPKYLQSLIIFAGAGLASAFLVAALLGAFWRRATAAGAMAAMVVGTSTTLMLYLLGRYGPSIVGLDWLLGPNPEIGAPSTLRPYYLFGVDPCVWGLVASLAAGVIVSLVTHPPGPVRLSLVYDAPPQSTDRLSSGE